MKNMYWRRCDSLLLRKNSTIINIRVTSNVIDFASIKPGVCCSFLWDMNIYLHCLPFPNTGMTNKFTSN